MGWIEVFDGTFWITIATIFTGSLALTVKYCLKSKCERVNICWGGLQINRNVELEVGDEETGGSIQTIQSK